MFPGAIIRGSDIHAGALGTARRNARRAGVTLKLDRLDARTIEPAELATGLLISNLPYGKRVERVNVSELQGSFGARLREKFTGWRYALLVEGEGRALGLKPSQVFEIDNGGIHCRLLVGTLE